MDEGKKLNLNRISNIIIFFLLIFIIGILGNIFEISNVINIPDNNISIIKKNKAIYSVFEGRFKKSEYATANIVKSLTHDETEEILVNMNDILDKKPKSYFKDEYIKVNVLNLIHNLKLTFITLMIVDIILSYLTQLNPFTSKALNRLKILQYYFLSMAVLGYFSIIIDMLYKNSNLRMVFDNPQLNLMLFSYVYAIKLMIEYGKDNIKV